MDLGPPSRGVASKSIPSARVNSALSSAMNRTLVPSGAIWLFHALWDLLCKRALGKMARDALEHKDVVDGNNIDVVDPLFFEPPICADIAGDVGTARSSERAGHANLRDAVKLILLPRSRKIPYKDVSAGKLSDVESLFWIIFFDCCVDGEFAARPNLFIGHGCNVVRNRAEDGGHVRGAGDVINPCCSSALYFLFPPHQRGCSS